VANGRKRSIFNSVAKTALTLSFVTLAATGALTAWKSHRLTSADPVGRSMTTGEVAMAQTVFGDKIDYAKVRLHKAPHSGDLALTIGNDIYLESRAMKAPDLSAPQIGVSVKKSLMHEMTHIFDNQTEDTKTDFWQSMRVLPSRLIYLFTGSAGFYKYNVDPKLTFAQANPEQRASMVETWFAAQEELNAPLCQVKTNDVPDNKLCRFSAQQKNDLTPRIRPSLPLPGPKK
jgi:hypothetical protein